MPVIFTPSFNKAPSAALPPRFSFCFLCSLYFFWFSTQFTLPPIAPPFLCSPPLIYCCFCWGREEKKTPLRLSSPPFVVFISPYLLFSSSLTRLLGCVFLIFLLFPPCLFWMLVFFLNVDSRHLTQMKVIFAWKRKEQEKKRRSAMRFLLSYEHFWLSRSVSNNLCPPILIGCIKGRGSAFVCMEYERFGCYVTWSFTGQAHIQTSFGQYRDFMPQIHPNPQDSHSHRPLHRYMSAARGG